MIKTISPVDGSDYLTAKEHGVEDMSNALRNADKAFNEWSALSVSERGELVTKFVTAMVADKDEIASEITWQMGRPISQSPGEVAGFAERAKYMIDIAPLALMSTEIKEANSSKRWIEKVPLGIVAVLSPWNYPLLTSVNAIVPALMAGNAVILKHSFQTPLVAERYAKAAKTAGIPKGVFQILHLNHSNTSKFIADQKINGVCFTGSVAGGVAVQSALVNKFIPCGLELGGKDPAYVRRDADLEKSIEGLVDGAFFNSGQSCCGIERIYVDELVYDKFLEGFVDLTKKYRLGNPLDMETNLGPMVKTGAADFVRNQIGQALGKGARSLVEESLFSNSRINSPYLSPHVLVDVNHSMEVMSEESFGPVVGIMKVKNDKEAIALMNDSKYGLTASVWTSDLEKAYQIGRKIEAGTIFSNRCDYLDPALAWTGVKDSGRGVSLSKFGYDYLTRIKSYNYRM